ncbi:cyclic nucleotide-binding domain-containing protein [Methyloprofundus sp.]|uniref:cyclic nucleotide-binding domain-containing protein n=1 Tax=Methyloprofundus sp. TaxID=2020875 RepID=UPI003D097131
MAVNPKSNEGKALRKQFPLLTMPAQQFRELCTTCDVSRVSRGDHLFKIGDATESFIYLIQGTVSLEANEFILETIKAGTDAAKFALAHQFPRKVSARAIDDVNFISLGLNAFDKTDTDYNEAENVYRVVNDDDDSEADASIDWLAAMLQSPVFQLLPAVNLQQVLMSLQDVKFSQGEAIFKQGDEGDYCFLIKKGRCTLSRKASEGGKAISYLELAEGKAFGEEAIITGEPRNMTVTATTDMLVSRIDAERFIKFIKEPVLKYIEYSDLQQEREQSPELLVIDIRSTEEYRKQHIPGSRNMPFFTLRMYINELMQEQGKIVVVCEDGVASDAAAFELIKNRMDAIILQGGIQSLPHWNKEENVPELVTEEMPDVIETEGSLLQKNVVLKEENERLMTELSLFKKQYSLLYKQTEKLKAALDKLRLAK